MTIINDDHEQAFPTIEGIKPYEQIVMELTRTVNDVKQSEAYNAVTYIHLKNLFENIALYHTKMQEEIMELRKARAKASDPRVALINLVEYLQETTDNTPPLDS